MQINPNLSFGRLTCFVDKNDRKVFDAVKSAFPAQTDTSIAERKIATISALSETQEHQIAAALDAAGIRGVQILEENKVIANDSLTVVPDSRPENERINAGFNVLDGTTIL